MSACLPPPPTLSLSLSLILARPVPRAHVLSLSQRTRMPHSRAHAIYHTNPSAYATHVSSIYLYHSHLFDSSITRQKTVLHVAPCVFLLFFLFFFPIYQWYTYIHSRRCIKCRLCAWLRVCVLSLSLSPRPMCLFFSCYVCP